MRLLADAVEAILDGGEFPVVLGGDCSLLLGAMLVLRRRGRSGVLYVTGMRSRTVEPVFGQLKTCQKLTMMSRRGLAGCEGEWLFACTARNLRKLHRHRVGG